MSDSSISCNRKAFASDEECSRGNVDISQFDDLPFCETINPGRSEIPPEILDTPLDLTIPPPCTCVNVDYKLGAKWSSDAVFKSKGSFRAKGDCCEGNYVSDLDLSIPCPIPYDVVYTTVKKRWVNEIQNDTVQLIKNTGDCSLGINDIDLSIPCPIKDVNGKISASVSYGTGNGTASTVIASSSSDCGINITGGSLDLSIPCPIPYDTGYTTIRKKWVEQIQDDEVKLIKNVDDCSLAVNDIDLSVPCPIPKFGYATVKKEWADSLKADRVKLISREGDCALSVNDFSLSIPCPSVKINKINVNVNTAWGAGSGSASLFKKYKDGCKFMVGGDINLNVPCPGFTFIKDSAKSLVDITPVTRRCGKFLVKSELSVQDKKSVTGFKIVSGDCSNVVVTASEPDEWGIVTLYFNVYYS